MPRLSYATRDTYPDELKYVWDRTMESGGDPAQRSTNIFLAVSNNPPLTRSFARFMRDTWSSCGLDAERRELVILRAAFLKPSMYEWHQHVRVARSAGVTDERVLAVRQWRAQAAAFSPMELSLLAYTDELGEHGRASDATFAELRRHLDSAGVVGTTLLIGFYFMAGLFMSAMGLETETAFVGWDLAGEVAWSGDATIQGQK